MVNSTGLRDHHQQRHLIQTGINSNLMADADQQPELQPERSDVAGGDRGGGIFADHHVPGGNPDAGQSAGRRTGLRPGAACAVRCRQHLAAAVLLGGNRAHYGRAAIRGATVSEPGGQTSANPQPQLEVTINPIYAEAGEVDVHASEFGGTGTIIAPNSADVTIINNSAASLNLLGIDIPETNGGL